MNANHRMMNKRIRALDNEIDRISALPDDVLCHILSFLPTKDAIRTSVLANRYKDLFAMAHNLKLVLYDTRAPNQPGEALMNEVNNFTNLMNRLITLNFHSVKSLSLTCQVIKDGRQIADWVGFFLALNLKRLNLRVSHLTSPTSLMEKLFGCGLKSLVVCIEATSYTSEYTFGLPNLKKFSAIMTPFAIVNAVVKGSPLLQKVAVINCSGDINENLCIKAPLLWDLHIVNSLPNFSGSFELDAPNITKFVLRGFLDQNYMMRRMGSIDVAQLEVYPNMLQLPSESREQAIRVLTACRESPKMWFSELMATSIVDYLPALPQLPNLCVVGMMKMDAKGWALLMKLLDYAPRLSSFVVKEGIRSSYHGRTVHPNDSVSVHILRCRRVYVLNIQRPQAELATASASTSGAVALE